MFEGYRSSGLKSLNQWALFSRGRQLREPRAQRREFGHVSTEVEQRAIYYAWAALMKGESHVINIDPAQRSHRRCCPRGGHDTQERRLALKMSTSEEEAESLLLLYDAPATREPSDEGTHDHHSGTDRRRNEQVRPGR